MKLLWSKSVPMETPWEPAYAGFFCKSADQVHFLYQAGRAVGVLTEDSDCVRKVQAEEHTISLPNRWVLAEGAGQPKLVLSEELALDLSAFEITHLPDAAEYGRLRKSEKYYVEASFTHDGYEISHKGNFGYQCRRNGEIIWEFRGQGYLYTDICFREDRVFFGTAGQGGYFYVLDLQTGELLVKIKTGGTASIITADDCCYILSNEKRAKLLCIGIKDGAIHAEAELPGKASAYSPLALIDGQIHAITFSYKKDSLQHAIWSCVLP